MTTFNYAQISFKTIRERGKIGYLDTQGYNENGTYNHPLYKDIFCYMDAYESLPRIPNPLLKHCAIVIPADIDEVHLHNHKEMIETYLENGGILVSFAQNFLPWLPGNSLYTKAQTPIKDRFIFASPHCITEGIRDYDINSIKGVKGFFSRGYFQPPKDACIFLYDDQQHCVGYIDSTTTNGIILATAGADLFGYPLLDNNTCKRLGINVLLWIESLLTQQKEAA
ncbi:MAG: hypothetical protein K2N12_02745 [Helicobacter sp.]|nr:hypothetical protein [Helicobacter sp.]